MLAGGRVFRVLSGSGSLGLGFGLAFRGSVLIGSDLCLWGGRGVREGVHIGVWSIHEGGGF